MKNTPRPTLHFVSSLLATTLLVAFFATDIFASSNDTETTITTLTRQIENSQDGKPKAKLYLYRARHYAKLGKKVDADTDYQNALKLDGAGWMINEYGYFLYNCGEYKQAYKVAKKVLEDFPHLKSEAAQLKKKAGEKFKEEYLAKNPPTIVMDVKVDPNRVTRHDLIRKHSPKSTTYKYPSVSKASASSSASGNSRVKSRPT